MTDQAPRARDLGIPFDGTPGPLNAITDVAGVEVGHTTLISRRGHAARSARGRCAPASPRSCRAASDSLEPVFAGWFALNGNGEMTGTTWIEESGFLEGPVLITNTHSVGVVRDAVDRLARAQRPARTSPTACGRCRSSPRPGTAT